MAFRIVFSALVMYGLFAVTLQSKAVMTYGGKASHRARSIALLHPMGESHGNMVYFVAAMQALKATKIRSILVPLADLNRLSQRDSKPATAREKTTL